MRLSVNIDHFATIREARRSQEPEPVLAALLAEQAGAEGIVCHLRGDRRHIKERDLRLFRQVIKTKLNLEMAATDEMKKIVSHQQHLAGFIKELQQAKIKVSIFVDPDLKQIEACRQLGVDLIEINTGKYADLKPGKQRDTALEEVRKAAEYGHKLGLEIHAGHGLDYRNIKPVAEIPQIKEFSIGFSIVARAAMVGVEKAVKEMIELIKES